jgi:hypothetical protein
MSRSPPWGNDREGVSFAKSVSDSRGDSPCSCDKRVRRTRGSREPQAVARVTRDGGCPVRPSGAGRENRGGGARVAGGWPGDVGLCGPSAVAMMQATDFGNGHNLAHRRPLDGPGIRRILLQ